MKVSFIFENKTETPAINITEEISKFTTATESASVGEKVTEKATIQFTPKTVKPLEVTSRKIEQTIIPTQKPSYAPIETEGTSSYITWPVTGPQRITEVTQTVTEFVTTPSSRKPGVTEVSESRTEYITTPSSRTTGITEVTEARTVTKPPGITEVTVPRTEYTTLETRTSGITEVIEPRTEYVTEYVIPSSRIPTVTEATSATTKYISTAKSKVPEVPTIPGITEVTVENITLPSIGMTEVKLNVTEYVTLPSSGVPHIPEVTSSVKNITAPPPTGEYSSPRGRTEATFTSGTPLVQYTTGKVPETVHTFIPHHETTIGYSETIYTTQSVREVSETAQSMYTSHFVPETSPVHTTEFVSVYETTPRHVTKVTARPEVTGHTVPVTYTPIVTCDSDLDCYYDATCIRQTCKNPCDEYKPCPVGVRCVVREHRPVCLCDESENRTAASVECRTLPGKHKIPIPLWKKETFKKETHFTWEIQRTATGTILGTCNIYLAISLST